MSIFDFNIFGIFIFLKNMILDELTLDSELQLYIL